jgi:hypothetical protein
MRLPVAKNEMIRLLMCSQFNDHLSPTIKLVRDCYERVSVWRHRSPHRFVQIELSLCGPNKSTHRKKTFTARNPICRGIPLKRLTKPQPPVTEGNTPPTSTTNSFDSVLIGVQWVCTRLGLSDRPISSRRQPRLAALRQ